ncbi:MULTISPECIES: SurA N-terminal domain-containing protein [Gammaproteobacteria]|uniref:SurA N-terminal domain-containing protein n=1 Tax=Gammaproteobacteria TaxID=1236 RepID=UPI000DCFBC90|nr:MULTISPECIES: SurA N-terminal domain-containing protein [Gammaproteobacteria]RTE86892.1 peptidylprolyl isomerase [Aliidiomarina sp. B3213]TCZ93318.1 peptidylprolyl isomerase [Lysobacter sp. N42]
MLERIREGAQGPIVKVVLGVLVVAFALTGVNAYLGGGVDNYVASVNGKEISRAEFDRAYQSQRSQMESQYGEMFAMLLADESYVQSLRNDVLEQLIEEELSIQFANELGLRQSDEGLRNIIRNMEQFNFNGTFNNDLYTRALMNLGMSAGQFRNYMDEQVNREVLLTSLFATDFSLDHEVDALQKLQNQTRSGRYSVLEGSAFADQVEITDADIESYYYDNESRFQVQEEIQLQYVALDLDDIVERTNVSEEEVRDYYDRNPQAYSSEESRRVAHILVEFGDDEAAALAEAEAALARIEAGEDFAEVAADVSDDMFSAQDGGDLGTLERGLIDPTFEDAGFELNEQGQVSDVVRSEFGFHIIKLTEFNEATQTPFEEVADNIRTELARVNAEDEYFRLQQELARISFEVPDTLEPAAQALGVDIQTSPVISRANPPEGFDSPDLLAQAFSSDVTERGLNSELVELAERSVVVRAESYQPAQTQPLADVRDQIVATLTTERAQDLALQAASDLRSRIESGDTAGIDFNYIEATKRFATELPGAVRTELFKMPFVEGESSFATVELRNGDAAVIELTDVGEGSIDESMNDRFAQELAGQYTEQSYRALMEALKANATIERRLR